MFTRARLFCLPVRSARYKIQICGISDVSTTKEVTGNIAQYPTIVPYSREADKRREKERWYNEIKRIETVEEKLFKINMPYYYGWKACIIKEEPVIINSLEFAQFSTRTHLMPEGLLPTFYDMEFDQGNIKEIIDTIKPQIKEAFVYELGDIPEDADENKEYVKKLVYQLNRIVMSGSSPKYPHLLTLETDYLPRLEAFWMVGSVDPPLIYSKMRANNNLPIPQLDSPIQYIGDPILHLRSLDPLREFISPEGLNAIEAQVPKYQYNPRCLGYTFTRQHATNIPGYWPRALPSFGVLSYNSISHLLRRLISAGSYEHAPKVQAMLGCFAWLHAQASYLGFSTFQDITYPLTAQMILTNGFEFYFCAYQLNTILLHAENSLDNPKTNLCWISEPMQLFEFDENNKLVDINEKTLELLVKFCVNQPSPRTGVEMQPYLGSSVKRIADIEEDERRVWLEKQFKHLMSNRPRHKLVPEIYAWQKFYIIDHNRRFMQKAREFRRKKTMTRTLDDHLPQYIPKCLRENPKKKKIGRFEKTFYP